jgi:hypothetical protein
VAGLAVIEIITILLTNNPVSIIKSGQTSWNEDADHVVD